MSTTLSPALGYLERTDVDAAAVIELATLLSLAVLVEPELVRAVRLRVAPRIAVTAEGDLWFSPLTWDRSAAGFTFVPEVVEPLRERLRRRLGEAAPQEPVWQIGEILDHVHASSPPLIQLEERITWLAISQGDAARPEIELALERAVRAVESGRVGVAQWAARELPMMPVEIHRTGAAHRLGRVSRPHVGKSIRLGAELVGALDAVAVHTTVTDVLVDLPMQREGERLLLGALEVERALGIQVPDTDPRLLHVTAGDLDETVSVPADGVVERRVGRGEVRIRTAAGAVYELPALAEEQRKRPSVRPGALTDVIVVVPDFTGSVLARDGKDIWNISGGGILRGLTTLGRSFDELVLEQDSPDVEGTLDGVAATEMVGDATLVPGLARTEGYSTLQRFLTEQLQAVPDVNQFAFPYDWRRDHRVAASRLAQLSRDWLASWSERSGVSDARLLIVAHGAGGLVAQYFTEVLEGWRETRFLVTIGTPFRGTLVALRQLVEGLRPGSFFDLTEAVRSWTSVYQMLPIYPCVEVEDGMLVRVSEVSLPGVDRRRAAEALAFHRETQDAIEEHQHDNEYLASGYLVVPVVGIGQPTLQGAVLEGETVRFVQALRGDDVGGDGVVSRPSALPLVADERYAHYVSERHGSLHRNEEVLDYLRNLVRGGSTGDVYRSVRRGSQLSVVIDDAFVVGEPIEFRIVGDDLEKARSYVEDVDSGARHPVRLQRSEGGAFEGFSSPLPQGTFRVVALDADSSQSATDLFVVSEGVVGPPIPP